MTAIANPKIINKLHRKSAIVYWAHAMRPYGNFCLIRLFCTGKCGGDRL
ncbi:MAG: hypothetical protein ACKOX2_03795 [Microcystaceae cyanobacterium]